MDRIAFRMKLFKGQEQEYKRRHDLIWPELAALLKETGIREYSIFLDEESSFLFGIMKLENASRIDHLSEHPIMKKWWDYMSDIMETNPDHSPVSIPLKEIFFL